MNLNRPLRTGARIWLAITTIPLFLAAWLLPGGKGGDEPVGMIWRWFLTHDYSCSDGEMLMGLAFYTLAFAVPATLVGWILQFTICLALDYLRQGRTKNEIPMA